MAGSSTSVDAKGVVREPPLEAVACSDNDLAVALGLLRGMPVVLVRGL